MRFRRRVYRMVAEGFVIVVSVLLALSAEAWWSGRQDATRAVAYLEYLREDFAQIAARADSSLASARRGQAAAGALLDALAAGPTDADAAAASVWILHALDYEVFSPSLGSYEALVSSGDLKLLDDPRLSVLLGEFFGSFEDVRVSERVLVEHQLALTRSDGFTRHLGLHRIAGYPNRMEEWREGADVPTSRARLVALAADDDFLSTLAALYMYQGGVALDYEFLEEKVAEVRARLASR